MKRLMILLAIGWLVPAWAHTPICACYNNGDGTISCEGGFSDGSSAAGVEMRVVQANGQVLLKGKISEDSDFSFDAPRGKYTVIFDGGPGHEVTITSDRIH